MLWRKDKINNLAYDRLTNFNYYITSMFAKYF